MIKFATNFEKLVLRDLKVTPKGLPSETKFRILDLKLVL